MLTVDTVKQLNGLPVELYATITPVYDDELKSDSFITCSLEFTAAAT